jgi:DNA-binding transcriptional ArsR family regulator
MIQEIGVKNPELNFDNEGLRKLASVYQAINHPVRLKILRLIHTHETISVTEICIKMRLDKEVASKQLSILRRAEVVYSVQRSRFHYYSINYKMLRHLQDKL